jgi:HAD superfamily hydrolase (TIGR01549 family)
MVNAILFDLGNTLFDLAPVKNGDMFRAGALRTYEYLRVRGNSLPSFSKYYRGILSSILWHYFREKLRGREFDSLKLMAIRCRRLKVETTPQMCLELAWEAYSPQVGYTTIEEDLHATLEMLQRRGIKLGIVSNTFVPGKVLDRHLAMTGLLPFFPVRIYSGDFGYRKPHRRIYEYALKQIGAAAEQTVFVGDRIDTDMIGARRAGMMTVLKSPIAEPKAHWTVDHTIRQIADLKQILPALRPPRSQAAVAAEGELREALLR